LDILLTENLITEEAAMAKILIAEDDAELQRLYADLLAEHQLQQASNGAEAVKMMAADPDVDLLITDWQMPELDGLGLIHALRQSGVRVPIILTTASLLPKDDPRVDMADVMFIKPFDVATFLSTVECLCAHPVARLR
jgi:CheY-like chemotaxis protein